MVADVLSSRRLHVVAVVVVLVAVAATSLLVVFRDEPSTAEGRDVATGDQLRATLVVSVADAALAETTATIRLVNRSEEPAWYRGDECDGPGVPVVGPEGARADGPTLGNGSIRDRLVAAGESALRVPLVAADPVLCDPDDTALRVEPGETVTWSYRTSTTPVDRSAAVTATAVVLQTDRQGQPAGRLRLAVPFDPVPGSDGLTIERAVDAFLSDPTVTGLLAVVDEDGVLCGVTRDGEIWRMSLGANAGDVSAEVHPDLTVRRVVVGERPT